MDTSTDDSYVDDEIFIGRPDAQRARELMETVSRINKIERRKTFAGVPADKSYGLPELSMEMHNVSITAGSTSGTREFVEESSQISFIDKVAEILDEPSSGNTTYVTAYDTEMPATSTQEGITDVLFLPPNDPRHVKMVKQLRPSALLTNQCVTLLDESLTSANRLSECPDNEESEVVIISDDEVDHDFPQYQATQIKYENVSLVEGNEGSNVDCQEQSHQESSSIQIQERNSEIINISDGHDDEWLRYQGTQTKYEDISLCEGNNSHVYEEDNSNYTDDVQELSEATSNVKIQETPEEEVYSFDDTLDDIDKYLKNGPNQSQESTIYEQDNVSLDVQLENQSPCKKASIKQTTTPSRQLLTNLKPPSAIPRMKSPSIETPIKGKSAEAATFKVPSLPRKKVTPNRLGKKPYGDIISPVSHYIKGSPRPPLSGIPHAITSNTSPRTPSEHHGSKTDRFKHIKSPISAYKQFGRYTIKRNVNDSEVPLSLPEHLFSKPENKNNSELLIVPERLYKPALKQYETGHAEIKLPNNIEALMPNVGMCVMTKHKGRVNANQQTSQCIEERLQNDQDLTIQCNSFDENISIVEHSPYL